MTESILESAESLLARCRATSGKTLGTPLREETLAVENRELMQKLEAVLDYHYGFAKVHRQLLRLVHKVRATLFEASNGIRFWKPSLPKEVKTAATLLNSFLRLNS